MGRYSIPICQKTDPAAVCTRKSTGVCKACNKVYNDRYYTRNADSISIKNKENRPKLREYLRKYRKTVRGEVKPRTNYMFEAVWTTPREYHRLYVAARRKNDPMFKLLSQLRKRIRSVITKKITKKALNKNGNSFRAIRQIDERVSFRYVLQ